MDAFSKDVLSRLPLAEAVLRCWQWAMNGPALQQIFESFRGRSYEGVLTFETIVNLTARALMEHGGSGNQAFERAAEANELDASKEAVYGKLRRIPISLSDGFFRACTKRLTELLPRRSARNSPVPKSLRHMEVLFVDGKKLKHIPRLLKPARGAKALILGGKTISALSWNTGLVKAIHADPDGETSDAPLVPGLMSQLNEDVAGERLFVEDRQFCDLVQPRQLTARQGDHFLIRYNAKVHFFRDPSQKLRHGTDEAGNRFVEEWGWLGKPDNPRSFYVRRITLTRPATPEDQAPERLILVTDLLDADRYPANDLLTAYRSRWGIENVFQKITEVFHLKNLISTTPEGTVFQFAFCMLLYNMIQLLTQYLAEAEKISVPTISQENVFNDVHRQMIAWSELVPPTVTANDLIPIPTAEKLRQRLQSLLSDVWTDRWFKAPPKKRKPPHHDTPHIPGAHVSIFRLIHGIPTPKKPARRRRK